MRFFQILSHENEIEIIKKRAGSFFPGPTDINYYFVRKFENL